MNSVQHSQSFELSIPIEKAFPLFSPEGEKHWVTGWEYRSVAGSKNLQEDDVFLTSTHNHRTTDAIWIVKRYDPEAYIVQYYKIEPEEKIGLITIECTVLSSSTTNVAVTYRYIALSKSGGAFLEKFTGEVFEDFIAEWVKLLENYLEN